MSPTMKGNSKSISRKLRITSEFRTRKPKAFTNRQLAIINFIAQGKKAKKDTFSLDELMDHLEGLGWEGLSRNGLIVCMNGLINRLVDSGVFIERVASVGRGKRQEYRIRKGV